MRPTMCEVIRKWVMGKIQALAFSLKRTQLVCTDM